MKQYNYIYRDGEDLDRYVKSNGIKSDSESILIQMFTSLDNAASIEKTAALILDKFPKATLIGSSTAGEIVEGKMLEQTTVLSISVFQKSHVAGFYAINEDSYELGLTIAKEAFNPKTKCVITFVDGLEHNGQEYLDGLASLNYNKAVVAGGMAADGLDFKQTYTVFGSKVFSGGAVCACLSGDDLLAYEEYNLGWKAVGPSFTITKSDGARVYEIDNKPVKELYAEVLGDFAVKNMPASTIEFPLIYKEGDLVVARSMLSVLADDTILYAGNLEEGQKVYFGIGSRDLVNKFTLQKRVETEQEEMQACFIYSCIARKEFLGEDLQKSFEKLNAIAPSSGFFTYGEFFLNKNRIQLLNVTTTMLFLRERGTPKQKRRNLGTKQNYRSSMTDSALFNLIDYVTRELQQQEAEFRHSKFKLDEFLKALDSTVIISRTDVNGVITYVNERFAEISGYTKEELLGEPHSIVRDPAVPAELFEEMWCELKRGNIWKGEFSNRAKDGSIYYVKSSIIPIHDEEHNIIEYMAIREDVTSLVESRKKAQKAEAAQAMFLANMSHEIRTPMNGILGFSELLAQTELDERQQKYIGVIESSTKLLLNIVNDILDSSKIASNAIVLETMPMHLASECETTFELLEPVALQKALEYKFEVEHSLAHCVIGDPLRLRQILTNLLSNAIKFTPEGGEVKLIIKSLLEDEVEQTVYFCVQDSGIGIAKNKQKNIFKPFAQADNSTTREFGGTGLGLSISSALVEAFGSKLQVESKEGEGSKFFFEITFKRCNEIFKQKESIEVKRENKRKCEEFSLSVLVAEDYHVNRMLIESLFQNYKSVKLSFAINGEEALQMLQEEHYDLLLMDINMPVLNGMEATKIIRQKLGLDIPIVALTANVIEEDRKKYIDCGMNDYLSKPIELEKLEAILCKYSQKNQPQSSLDITKQLQKIYEKLGLSETMAKRILATFLESLKEYKIPLFNAAQNDDFETLYKIAHKIKGAAGSLFIDELYSEMEKIETKASQKLRVHPEALSFLQKYIQELETSIDNEVL
jgi:PAS domain S-box-containing protein